MQRSSLCLVSPFPLSEPSIWRALLMHFCPVVSRNPVVSILSRLPHPLTTEKEESPFRSCPTSHTRPRPKRRKSPFDPVITNHPVANNKTIQHASNPTHTPDRRHRDNHPFTVLYTPPIPPSSPFNLPTTRLIYHTQACLQYLHPRPASITIHFIPFPFLSSRRANVLARTCNTRSKRQAALGAFSRPASTSTMCVIPSSIVS